jgi:hypothetical protein
MDNDSSFIRNELYDLLDGEAKVGHIRYEWYEGCVFVHPIIYKATPKNVKLVINKLKELTPKLLDKNKYDLAWFYTDNDKYVKLLGGDKLTFAQTIENGKLYYIHRKDMI